MLTGQFHLDVYCSSVRNTVAENISFAVAADSYEATVFRIKLPDRMVPSDAAVLTEGYDNLVL